MSFRFECTILKETDAVIKVEVEDVEIWLPRSTVIEIHRTNPTELVVEDWIARAKGLM